MLSDKKFRLAYNKALRAKGVPAKACNTCFVVKAHGQFHKDSKTPDGCYARCRACDTAAKAAWRAANPDYKRANDAAWREANPDYHREWREANPNYQREYDRTHRPDRGLKRRAQMANAPQDNHTRADMLAHWDEWDLYRCVFCDGPFEHIEHLVPLARGGGHVVENLSPACAECNLSKGARDPYEWLSERLRGPLRDEVAKLVGRFPRA